MAPVRSVRIERNDGRSTGCSRQHSSMSLRWRAGPPGSFEWWTESMDILDIAAAAVWMRRFGCGGGGEGSGGGGGKGRCGGGGGDGGGGG